MFGRSILTLLALASLGWIAYVIITIGSNNFSPTPSMVFSKEDQSIAIIHRIDEIDFNNSDYSFIQEEPFYLQVLAHPERVQHFYFSSGRHLMVLERSKPWNFEIIDRFATKMGLGATLKSSKSVHFSNGWIGQFHGKYLVLADQFEPTFQENELVQWNFIDRKCSTSIIKKDTSGKFFIENAYTIGQSQVKYISQSAIGALPLVDDADYFSSVTPASFSSYTFYEKNYASALFGKHPFFEFSAKGMVCLEKEGGTIYVLDYEKGQEPMAILNSYLGEDDYSSKRAHITTLGLPINKEMDWYIEVFNGYAFVSTESELIDQLIGAYESGNTLAQNSEKFEKLFRNTPKKVSYRHIDSKEHITKSCLSTTIHSVIEQRNENEDNVDNAEIPPLRIDGNATAILPVQGTHQLIVFTDAPSVHLVVKNDLIWSNSLDGEIIGDPIILPSTQQIAFCTQQGLHLLNMNGNEANGFPISGNVQSPPEALSGQGGAILGAIIDNQIACFSGTGKRTVALATGITGPCRMMASTQKGAIIIDVVNQHIWKTFNIKKKSVLQSKDLGSGDWFLSRRSNNILPVGIQKNKFYRVGDNGKTSVLIGNSNKVIRVQNTKELQLFFVVQQHSIHVINGEGNYVTHFDTRLNNIDDAYYYRTSGGKIAVGLLDGIANNVYIYSVQGNDVSKKAYEGSGKIALHKTGDGSAVLVSTSNGYLLRYPLDLN